MSNWWYATSVDVEQGSDLVRVNTGDDTRYFERGSCWLKIAGHDAVETDGLITDGSDTFIRLVKDWSGDTDTGRRAFAFRTVPDFQGVADKLALNIEASQGVVDNVISKMGTLLTSTDESVVIETAEGDVEVVPWGYIEQQVEQQLQDFLNNNQTTIDRLRAMEKLRDNAVLYLDFCGGEGKDVTDLSVNRASAVDLIDYTAPDGQTGVTADGRVVTAGVDEPAIVWRDGECQGLQVVPESTNLLHWSEDLTNSYWGTSGLTPESTSIKNIDGDQDAVKLIPSSDAGWKRMFKFISVTAGTRYTQSWLVKAGEVKYVSTYFRSQEFGGSNNSNTLVVDLETGQANTGGLLEDYGVEKLGNGWLRIHITKTCTTTSSTQIVISPAENLDLNSSPVTTGDGTVGLFAAAPKFEKGYLTPYIPTEDSQVTRGAVDTRAEIAVNPSRWSFLCEFYFRPHEQRQIPFKLYPSESGTVDTSLNHGITAEIRGNFDFRVVTRDSNGSYTSSINTLNTEGELNKVLYRYEDGNLNVYLNGAQIIYERGVEPLSLSAVRLGSGLRVQGSAENYTTYSNCVISKFVLTGASLTDAEAITLTTLEA